MELDIAVRLIKNGVDTSRSSQQVWADLGAGKGLFTQALASTLPPGSTVLAVDKDAVALQSIKIIPNRVTLLTQNGDFTKNDIGESKFDGLLMANSLHFVKDKVICIRRLLKTLKTGGRILLIEYDMTAANPWVPWPLSFEALKDLVSENELGTVTKLAEHPSVYNRANMYAAVIHPPS